MQGIATEAALATRDEAFDRCGLEELIGRCRVENVASARVLAKVGFERLRLFELDDGIVVEIHRLQRADWTRTCRTRGPATSRERPRDRERSTVRRGSRLAVVDRADDERVALRRRPARRQPEAAHAAPRPRHRAESVIEVDGEQWTVADVRPADAPRRS